MSQTIPHLLRALYQRLHGQPPDESTAKQLDLIAYEDGLRDSAPDWLVVLLAALAENGSFADRTLTSEQFLDRRYALSDFFLNVAPVLGIDHMDDGEYLVLSLEPLGISVCLDFETVTGGVDVRLMRWPEGPWPHFERWPVGHPLYRPPAPGAG
jgi:hypothetical protein